MTKRFRRGTRVAVIDGDVRFIQDRTLYGRTGDVFAWACVALTLLVAFAAWSAARPATSSR